MIILVLKIKILDYSKNLNLAKFLISFLYLNKILIFLN